MFELIVLCVLIFSLYKAVEAHKGGNDDIRRLASVSTLFCAMLIYFMVAP